MRRARSTPPSTSAFRATDDGGTTAVAYDADAVVGGMVGGVGQRMLGSVSKRMAGEFFGNVAACDRWRGRRGARRRPRRPARPASRRVGQVFTAPARPADAQQEFLKGIAVGAGLVLLGVVAGSLFGRRRR